MKANEGEINAYMYICVCVCFVSFYSGEMREMKKKGKEEIERSDAKPVCFSFTQVFLVVVSLLLCLEGLLVGVVSFFCCCYKCVCVYVCLS